MVAPLRDNGTVGTGPEKLPGVFTMATEERIAAVAGKLSRLQARYNDLGEEITELKDELAALKKPERTPAAKKAGKRKRSSGHADEFDPDDPDNDENDDPEDADPEDEDPEDADPDDEKPARRPRRR